LIGEQLKQPTAHMVEQLDQVVCSTSATELAPVN
jgi:hypothetical protein